jgi:hypothetical protein
MIIVVEADTIQIIFFLKLLLFGMEAVIEK